MQDKLAETAFFERHAALEQEYDAFAPRSNKKLLLACLRMARLPNGSRVVDVGCGSGIFTDLLKQQGFRAVGLDLNERLVTIARSSYGDSNFIVGDAEDLPFSSESLEGILLSGVLHHLPDPSRCAGEVGRVLKPGGVFVAFDPNRRNPFMWLYRVKSSPFYSSKGVTPNEQPVSPTKLARVFESHGFQVTTDYVSGLQIRYLASRLARIALPVYNLLDSLLFRTPPMKPYSAFVLTMGVKAPR